MSAAFGRFTPDRPIAVTGRRRHTPIVACRSFFAGLRVGRSCDKPAIWWLGMQLRFDKTKHAARDRRQVRAIKASMIIAFAGMIGLALLYFLMLPAVVALKH